MSSNTTKNYTAQGGSLTVIGGELQILGKLTIDPGAEVVGLADVSNMPIIAEAVSLDGIAPCEYQPDSTATNVAQLREDFNELLSKLRAAGILASEAAPDEQPDDSAP